MQAPHIIMVSLLFMKTLFDFFHKHRKRTGIMAAVWTLAILAACLIPGREIPNVNVPLADKWVHFILFAVFSFLWLFLYRHASLKQGLYICLLSSAFGYVVELLQGSGLTRGRSYDPFDWFADSIGGVLGMLLFFCLRRFFGNKKPVSSIK